jgi:hypothetical protein
MLYTFQSAATLHIEICSTVDGLCLAKDGMSGGLSASELGFILNVVQPVAVSEDVKQGGSATDINVALNSIVVTSEMILVDSEGRLNHACKHSIIRPTVRFPGSDCVYFHGASTT